MSDVWSLAAGTKYPGFTASASSVLLLLHCTGGCCRCRIDTSASSVMNNSLCLHWKEGRRRSSSLCSFALWLLMSGLGFIHHLSVCWLAAVPLLSFRSRSLISIWLLVIFPPSLQETGCLHLRRRCAQLHGQKRRRLQGEKWPLPLGTAAPSLGPLSFSLKLLNKGNQPKQQLQRG